MWLSSRVLLLSAALLASCSTQRGGGGGPAGPGAPTTETATSAVAAPPGPCVDVLKDCTANSERLERVCGAGEHELAPMTKVNASTLVFGEVTKVTIQHCADGGPLAGQRMELTTTTSLCALPGGCCEEGGKRWNDQICFITIE